LIGCDSLSSDKFSVAPQWKCTNVNVSCAPPGGDIAH